jgi:hypothetical protein
MNKEDREKEKLLKEKVLYKLLFKDKVKKLGNLTIEHHDGYVVVDSGGKEDVEEDIFDFDDEEDDE